jgi:hypothetical protein
MQRKSEEERSKDVQMALDQRSKSRESSRAAAKDPSRRANSPIIAISPQKYLRPHTAKDGVSIRSNLHRADSKESF